MAAAAVEAAARFTLDDVIDAHLARYRSVVP